MRHSYNPISAVNSTDTTPDNIEQVKKCLYAVRQRYIYNRPWALVAATLWPRDEFTDCPTKDAKPMWGSASAAATSVARFQRAHLTKIKEEFVNEVRTRSEARQTALAERILQGDLDAIAKHRAEDVFMMKVLGGFAPVKIAPTNPDGTEQYSPPADDAIQSVISKLDQLGERRKTIISQDLIE